MVSNGGSGWMSNIEKNDEILSFEELRKKLGMDSEPQKNISVEEFTELAEDIVSASKETTVNKNISADDLASEIERQLEEQVEVEKLESDEPATVVEDGGTFVDITAQYVKKPEEEAVKNEPVVETITNPKKKVKTFNEMFSDFFKNLFPNKNDSTKEKIRKTIMDLSIITIIGCIIAFGELYRQNLEQLEKDEEIKSQIVQVDEYEENEYVEAWEELFAQYPEIKFPQGMNLKFSYLYALNQDLVGWLKIDGTNLDVQVVQGPDNDYYLRRDFYGDYSRYGCPYMDYKNDPKYLNDNTVIYGHHMTDGLMFSNLDKYKTLEGYKESPVIEYSTLYETYHFKVFAAFFINATPADDNNYFFNFMISDFSTDERFAKFVDELKKRSVIDTGISVQPDDKLLTLVTCTYDFNDARFVVVGRMVRENEDVSVDTSLAKLNTSPKYPQAWYDVKGLTNPYKYEPKWDE